MSERDLVVTWPKSRVFGSYMVELERAKMHGQLINYRVPRPPPPKSLVRAADVGLRLYRVHSGEVRGWTSVLDARWRRGNEVARVNVADEFWPPGYYLICAPEWHPCRRIAMPGFRGWRWFDRTSVGA